MKNQMMKKCAIAIALSSFAVVGVAAQDDKTIAQKAESGVDKVASTVERAANSVSNTVTSWVDRVRMGDHSKEKDRLEELFAGAQSVQALQQMIEEQGYAITSVNARSDDGVEYEIARAGYSYEVQAELESGRPTEIDVSSNIWRAEATERAMNEADYKPDPIDLETATGAQYRDKDRMSAWMTEKEALQKTLTVGKPLTDYRQMLQDQGYSITSVNEVDEDSAEYEIVKANQSFEVKMELGGSPKVVEEIDVAPNVWQSKETEKALGQQ